MADPLCVLVIDEDPDSRVETRKAVQRGQFLLAGEEGYGPAAVGLAVEACPDLVLIAMEEPVARALETAEAIANALPGTPFIIYSSLKDADSIRRAMIIGARDYIVKPVVAPRLTEAVDTLLRQEERRRLRQSGELVATGGRGSVIAVTGAKGGTGKTVIAVNLALALRQETGRTVAILDADTEFGDVVTMLDMTPTRTLADVWPVLGSLDRETIGWYLTVHASGVDVLATPPDGEGWVRGETAGVKQVIDLLAQTHDFVVVDTSGSFDSFVRACVESSTLALVVTSGEVSSIRDTAAAVRRLASWEIDSDRFKIVMNRGPHRNRFRSPELAEAINCPVFWELPADPQIPLSIELGQPILLEGKSAAARNLMSLARTIAGTKRSLVDTVAPDPWWRRLGKRS